jgi:hypothetical protein
VLTLPFHLMITYTGLVTLMAMLMPWAVVANYADPDALYDRLFPRFETQERTGMPMPLTDIGGVVRDAERRLRGPVGSINVAEPGDAAATITVTRAPSTMLSSRTPSLTYRGTDGKLLWQSRKPGGASVTAGAMIGLHAGRFADYGLRWLYFLCGVGGTLMVASGLVLWTVKRREKLPDPERPHFGFRLVEWLNIAVVGGFPLGIAAMFWANRLLPLALKDRADWEIHALFIAWGLALVAASALRASRAWAVLLGATGALLAMIPVYNLWATPRGLVATVLQGDFVLAGIDCALVVFGAGFLATAWRVASYRPAPKRARKRLAATAQAATPGLQVMEPAE